MSDHAYPACFFAETAPAHIAFALAAAGFDPGRSLRPRRVLELGFGRGFGLTLLAASNPDVTFEGYDVDERHVAHARTVISEARLSNIVVEPLSFEAVAARGGAKDVDVAVLHGVYAWIPPAARAAILVILAQRMVEGGIVMVSYNCAPGWSPLDPIRQLAGVVTRLEKVPSRRVEALLELLTRLDAADAGYVVANPLVRRHLVTMREADRAYLEQEYFCDRARSFAFEEVHDDFAGIGFEYCASATITENIDAYAVPARMRDLFDPLADRVVCETLRDIGVNKSFRRDLYRRGSVRSSRYTASPLSDMSFALIVPPGEITLVFGGPLGDITGHEPIFRPIVDKLAAGVASFADMTALPAFVATNHHALVEALSLLVQARQVAPFIIAPGADPVAAHRFNRVIIERAARGEVYGHFASPVTRSGVAVEAIELCFLAARLEGCHAPDGIARRASEMLLSIRGGAGGTDPSMTPAAVATMLEHFEGGPLLILKAVHCLGALGTLVS